MRKRRLTYQISCLLLAMLTMAITASVSVNAHYCQGQLKNVSLLGKAKACESDAQLVHCEKKNTNCKKKLINSECEKGCCDTEQVILESPDDLIQSEVVSFNYELSELISYVTTPEEKAKVISFPKPEYLNFKPPLSGKRLLLLHQTFLI
ncbi:MAG: hypothetical protein HKN92_00840 [Chitinophagales bacterium]|nr:hypothetical protein [Chitinophagales bacterium]